MITYNGEAYIKQQLDSILTQTLQNFELVICDDCSSDSTFAILSEYAERDKRIRLYRQEQNVGLMKNVEYAIGLCQYEYVALSDQDDIWTPNHLEVLWQQIGDKALSVGESLLIDENEQPHGTVLPKDYVVRSFPEMLYSFLMHGNFYQGATMLFKKEVIQRYLPIPEGARFHDIWFLFCLACDNQQFVATRELLTHYRMHQHNLSGEHTKKNLWTLIRKTINDHKAHLVNDRLVYCDLLLQNFPNMSPQVKQIVQTCQTFIGNRMAGKHRLQTIWILTKYYKLIYATHSYRYWLARSVRLLLNM